MRSYNTTRHHNSRFRRRSRYRCRCCRRVSFEARRRFRRSCAGVPSFITEIATRIRPLSSSRPVDDDTTQKSIRTRVKLVTSSNHPSRATPRQTVRPSAILTSLQALFHGASSFRAHSYSRSLEHRIATSPRPAIGNNGAVSLSLVRAARTVPPRTSDS